MFDGFTTPKTYGRNLKNWCFIDVSLFPFGVFSGSMLVFRGVCLLCWFQVCEDFKSPWRGFPKSWSWQFRLFVFSEVFLTDFKAPLPKNHHTKKNKKMHCKDRQCFCLTLFYPWIHNNVSLKTGQLLSKKGHHRRFGESPKFQCSTSFCRDHITTTPTTQQQR